MHSSTKDSSLAKIRALLEETSLDAETVESLLGRIREEVLDGLGPGLEEVIRRARPTATVVPQCTLGELADLFSRVEGLDERVECMVVHPCRWQETSEAGNLNSEAPVLWGAEVTTSELLEKNEVLVLGAHSTPALAVITTPCGAGQA